MCCFRSQHEAHTISQACMIIATFYRKAWAFWWVSRRAEILQRHVDDGTSGVDSHYSFGIFVLFTADTLISLHPDHDY